MREDIEDDLDDVDGIEDVFLTYVGTNVEVEVKALRHQISAREAAASGGAYTVADTMFNVKAKALDAPPGIGSLISTDDRAETWTVFGVDRAAARTRYRILCKRAPALSTDAPDTEYVTLEKVTYIKDADGAKYPTWSTLASQVLARVSEIEAVSVVDSERKRLKVSHQVFVDADYATTVTAGQRIRRGSGELLLVRRVTGKSTLGGQVVLECERQRRPADA